MPIIYVILAWVTVVPLMLYGFMQQDYIYLRTYTYILYYLRCFNRDNFPQISSTSHSVRGMGNGNLKNWSNRFDHTTFTNETDHWWLNKFQFAWDEGRGWRELYLQITLHMNELQVHVKEMKTFNLMGVLPRLVVRIYIHTKRYAHESTIRMIRKRETDRGKEEEKKLI